MRVLVAMEFSGVVRDAFTALGHDAMSCDFLPSETPGKHYQGNVLDILKPGMWDLIIAHPECTAVCNAGNKHYGEGQYYYPDRLSSAYWIANFWRACKRAAPRVCFENPPGVLPAMTRMPKPFYIQPWQHGHPEKKRTGLYLHNLPVLRMTNDVYDEMMELPRHKREAVFYMAPSEDRWKDRSRTYAGIAMAMSLQWSNL